MVTIAPEQDTPAIATLVELRLLRYFAAVARERSFTRAADGLHLSQQAVSSAIRQLECHLGVQLLERSSVGVDVTPAGQVLLEDAGRILCFVEDACSRALHVAHELDAPLRIGYSWTEGEATVAALRRTMSQRPAPAWTARAISRPQLREELIAGRMDASILTEPDCGETLTATTLRREPLIIVCGQRHRLTRRADPIPLTALDGLPLAVVARADAPRFHDRLVELVTEAGATPELDELRMAGREADAAAYLHESDRAMLAPASASPFLRAWGLSPRPLKEPAFVEVALLRTRHNEDPQLARFVRTARAAARSLGWLQTTSPRPPQRAVPARLMPEPTAA